MINSLNLITQTCSSEDPDQDIKALLGKFSSNPDTEAQQKLFLPLIISSFGANKSVTETVEELKKHQQSSDATSKFLDAVLLLWFLPFILNYTLCLNSIFLSAVAEWANEALQGLGKGAPFSLCLTQKHFSKVASAYGIKDNVLSTVSPEFSTTLLSYGHLYVLSNVYMFPSSYLV